MAGLLSGDVIIVKKRKASADSFSRGEGGPPERSEEKAGRKRNAGGNLKVSRISRLAPRLVIGGNAGGGLEIFKTDTSPPAFLSRPLRGHPLPGRGDFPAASAAGGLTVIAVCA